MTFEEHKSKCRTTVVHIGDGYDVFIGRPSKWGNPYKIGRDGTREQVIAKYRATISDKDREVIQQELKGKRLGCFCAPEPCHGDVLAEIADEDEHE